MKLNLPEVESLVLEVEAGWLTIWFNRPESRNALSDTVIAELFEVLKAIQHDRRVRGVSFRGKGGVFCAGGDLKGFKKSLQKADRVAVVEASKRAARLFSMINSLPQVTVMVVEGAAMAGGLGMVATGDVVIAEPAAKFALTETMLGIPPAQIAPYLVQKFGYSAARRLMLTAARFNGTEAKELGLIDYLVEGSVAIAETEKALKKQVLRCAPGAVAATKSILLDLQAPSLEQTVDRAAHHFADCLLGSEGREGIAAFVQKRPPEWAIKHEGDL